MSDEEVRTTEQATKPRSELDKTSDEFISEKKHSLGRLLGHLGITIPATLSSVVGAGVASLAANAGLFDVLAKTNKAIDLGLLGSVSGDQILKTVGVDVLKAVPPLAAIAGIFSLGGAAVGWQGAKHGSTMEKLAYLGVKVAEPLLWIAAPMLQLPGAALLAMTGLSAGMTLFSQRKRR